jgi:hypothetical protein
MPSQAFASLKAALQEVSDLARLVRFPPIGRMSSTALRAARAASRAQVVLLSSHFERYIYSSNEEAVTFLNAGKIASALLPERLRLLHSRYPIDEIAEVEWVNRAHKLGSFVSGESWLWTPGGTGVLSHERLLMWLTAPKPSDLVRYYRYWGIEDIFAAITRNAITRGRLRLGVQELVDLRNNIAHGNFTAQATPQDVQRFIGSVRTFCLRADRHFGTVLGKLNAGVRPW